MDLGLTTSFPAAIGGDSAGVDVTAANFMAEVIEASKTQLVIVAFWAAWQASSKQMAQLLAKVVAPYPRRVKLAKIDADRCPQIAQQMGVQSVPAVFAFFRGQPVDGFMGIVPEAQASAWVDRLIKATGVEGDAGQGTGIEAALRQAEHFFTEGDFETAQSIYADILEQLPDNAGAYAGLAKCLLNSGGLAQARELLAAAPEAVAKDKAVEAVKVAVELAEQAAEALGVMGELQEKLAKNPEDHQVRFDLAMAFYASGEREKAVDELLEIVRRERAWNEEAARKQLVKFFEAFGNMDPLTVATRKRLSTILFA